MTVNRSGLFGLLARGYKPRAMALYSLSAMPPSCGNLILCPSKEGYYSCQPEGSVLWRYACKSTLMTACAELSGGTCNRKHDRPSIRSPAWQTGLPFGLTKRAKDGTISMSLFIPRPVRVFARYMNGVSSSYKQRRRKPCFRRN